MHIKICSYVLYIPVYNVHTYIHTHRTQDRLVCYHGNMWNNALTINNEKVHIILVYSTPTTTIATPNNQQRQHTCGQKESISLVLHFAVPTLESACIFLTSTNYNVNNIQVNNMCTSKQCMHVQVNNICMYKYTTYACSSK